MIVKTLESIQSIEKQYNTGERPVLVMCSDFKSYVCKYMRSSLPAQKLVCEYVGQFLANIWNIPTPSMGLINIKPSHWNNTNISHVQNVPSLGSRYMEGVIDISLSTYSQLRSNLSILQQILRIALFDFWTANEDRNFNNANLMYSIKTNQIIAIDYGCIFNTGTFDYPLTQLTTTDTILYSDLFKHIASAFSSEEVIKEGIKLKNYYEKNLIKSSKEFSNIIINVPTIWGVSPEELEIKLKELFEDNWIKDSYENFLYNLNSNLK